MEFLGGQEAPLFGRSIPTASPPGIRRRDLLLREEDDGAFAVIVTTREDREMSVARGYGTLRSCQVSYGQALRVSGHCAVEVVQGSIDTAGGLSPRTARWRVPRGPGRSAPGDSLLIAEADLTRGLAVLWAAVTPWTLAPVGSFEATDAIPGKHGLDQIAVKEKARGTNAD